MRCPWKKVPKGTCTLVLIVLSSLCQAQSGDGDDEDGYEERTTYACEYGLLSLECPPGSVIRIDRANYGRFSLKLCNLEGRTENMDLTCQNIKTTEIVSTKCDGHRQCDFRVNNEVFEDPCPGTSKYIEVRHHCSPVEYIKQQTTTKPSLIQIDGRPPWLVSSVPVPENLRVCQRLYSTGFISWSMPRDGISTVYNKFKLKSRRVNETQTEEMEINIGNAENGRYAFELGFDVLSTPHEYALKAATADGGWGDYSLFVRPETCHIPPNFEPKTSPRSFVPPPANIRVCQHPQSSNSFVDIYWSMPLLQDGVTTAGYSFMLKYRRVNAAEVEEKEINATALPEGNYAYILKPDLPQAQYEYALKARTDGDWGEYSSFVWPEICFGPLRTLAPQTTTTSKNPANKKCPQVYRENTVWPEANPNDVITGDCPDGMGSGKMHFKCLLGGIWDPNGPEMDNCQSSYVETTPKWNVEVRPTSPFTTTTITVSCTDKADAVLKGLGAAGSTDVAAEADKMFNVITSLPALSQNMSSELTKTTDLKKKKQKANKFKESIVSIGSEVLKDKARWRSLDPVKRKAAAQSLLSTMETTGLLTASSMDVGMTDLSRKPSIVMKLVNVDLLGEQGATLTEFPADNSGSKFNEITIPLATVRQIGVRRRALPVVLVILSNMSEWLAPSGFQTSYNSLPDVDSSSYIYAGNTYPPELPRRRVNSDILSASASDKPVRNLTQPIVFLVEHMQTEAVANPKCSFWDTKNSTWSQEGCKLRFTNKTHTSCECNHLTSFAVIMDVTGVSAALPAKARFSLEIITYVGCTISIICLMLSWITFTVFKSLDCDRNTIHKHLVFCLMLAQIVLVVGIQQTQPKILCSVIAGLLHFLFLASFAWMCLEGVQLYVMLIEVFESERSRVVWYYLFGYGVPAIIVAISAGIFPQGYGTDGHCWLTTERGFIWSFVGPALGVMVVNIIMLSIAIYIMVRHSSISHTMRHKSMPQKMRTWIKGAVVLVVLLGLTWLFGVLYLDRSTMVFAYIFTILNSLQGLFIFIFHCLLNDKVQKEYRRFVRHASWMPSCVRVHYGGTSSGSVSREPSSSGNVVARFFRGKKRGSEPSSSTSNSAKPFLHKEQRHIVSSSEGPSSSQVTSETGTNNNTRKSSRSSSTNSSGNGYKLPRLQESDGVMGDLSEIPDCSIVDSEFVSEYCRENLQVSAEVKRYSTASEDSRCMGGSLYENCVDEDDQDRLAALSFESLTKRQSPYVSSSEVHDGAKVITIEEDTSDEEDVDDADVRRLRASLPAESRPLVTQSESEKVLIKNAVNKPREQSQGNAAPSSASPSLRDVSRDEQGREPQVQGVPHASAPNLKFKAGASKHTVLPTVLSPDKDKDVVNSLPNLSRQKSNRVPLTAHHHPPACSSGSAPPAGQSVKRHSSDGHMYFSPFRFSATSDC